MVGGALSEFIQHLRRKAGVRANVEVLDAQLLERFVATREEAAFETLLERHGPMVLGVCRYLLQDPHDVEDAFQADPAAEQADRERSKDNLKGLGLAMYEYKDVNMHFPPAALYDSNGKALLSWRVLILPYLHSLSPAGKLRTRDAGDAGQDELFKEFKLDEPWDSEHNKKLLAKMPKQFAPVRGKTKQPNMTYYQVFTGKGTGFEGIQGVSIADIQDGTKNTIAVVEAAEAVPWTKPADLPYDPSTPLPKLGGMFSDVFHAAFFDGAVQTLKRKFDEKTMRHAITRSGGEILDLEKIEADK